MTVWSNKTSLSACLLVGLLWLGACSSSRQITSWPTPPPSALQVDGQIREWTDTAFTSLDDGALAYALTHDGDHLYLCVRVQSLTAQTQVLLAGFYVWVDEKGGKKDRAGIHYPLGLPEADRPGDPVLMDAIQKDLLAERESRLAGEKGLELLGLNGKGSVTWGKSDNPQGVQAAADYDSSGTMILEMSWPLQAFFRGVGPWTGPKARKFRLGLETGHLGRPDAMSGNMAAVGISGTNPANPSRMPGEKERRYQQILERYRRFTIPSGGWTRPLRLVQAE